MRVRICFANASLNLLVMIEKTKGIFVVDIVG